MGLLSSLFSGNVNLEKAAELLLSGAARMAKNAMNERVNSGNFGAQAKVNANSYSNEDVDDDVTSGFSWGENMPVDENQYNYNGTFMEYFEFVIKEEYPMYKLVVNHDEKQFLLYDGAKPVLVVEILSERNNTNWLRNKCKFEGTPYCRFYYDHQGWWNTREYVKHRTHLALDGKI
ncbi:MAG TPA: hypothetical protein DD722_04065 [Lachnospiraceae bacterium]|nr:hypothetical protein [Lachnospiraceae bacterium]